MERTNNGGDTGTDIVGSLQLQLHRHSGWTSEALEHGEATPTPVGGMTFSLEWNDTLVSELQVLRSAVDLLTSELQNAAFREGTRRRSSE